MAIGPDLKHTPGFAFSFDTHLLTTARPTSLSLDLGCRLLTSTVCSKMPADHSPRTPLAGFRYVQPLSCNDANQS
jgi:hypothetical protein